VTRRTVVLLPLAAVAAPPPFRYSVCNETFQSTPFLEQCRLARRIGYKGIEIMPGTLAPDPPKVPAKQRAEWKRLMAEEGIAFVGLHNLLSAPAGLHATTANAKVYRRTWDHLRALVALCGDLGGGVMVFGSGRQRNAEPGMSRASAIERLTSGLAGIAGDARQAATTILIEPLAPHLSNIVNTLDAAASIVRQIGSPAVQTIFDVHNTAAEKESAAALISRYGRLIRHVHLNEMDGKRPGAGSYDFGALLRALRAARYEGWLSLEVFDLAPSGEEVARRALEYLKKQE
jgi:sugar phosphate isomerase/epimerase